jgi:hypothetical protein
MTASMSAIVSAARAAELCPAQCVAVPRIASIHAACRPTLPKNFSLGTLQWPLWKAFHNGQKKTVDYFPQTSHSITLLVG